MMGVGEIYVLVVGHSDGRVGKEEKVLISISQGKEIVIKKKNSNNKNYNLEPGELFFFLIKRLNLDYGSFRDIRAKREL